MPFFMKKPVAIEAKQFTEADAETVATWCSGSLTRYQDGTPRAMLIFTLEGPITAKMGDWIIRGVRGEFYPCDREIFEETYTAVESVIE